MWAKAHDVRAAALGCKIPSLRTRESLDLPSPSCWCGGVTEVHGPGERLPCPCTTRLVTGCGRKPTTCALRRSGVKPLPRERGDPSTSPLPSSGPPHRDYRHTRRCNSAATVAAVAAEPILPPLPTNPLPSLCTAHHFTIIPPAEPQGFFPGDRFLPWGGAGSEYITPTTYMHSYCIHVPFHALHCPIAPAEQGTCVYCHGRRRRYRSCHDGAVAYTSPPPAASSRCRSPPAGSPAVRSGVPPSVLPLRGAGYWTAPRPPPPSLLTA